MSKGDTVLGDKEGPPVNVAVLEVELTKIVSGRLADHTSGSASDWELGTVSDTNSSVGTNMSSRLKIQPLAE